MTSEMRFGEQKDSGDAARFRKAVPGWIADDAQSEIGDDSIADSLKGFGVSKQSCRT